MTSDALAKLLERVADLQRRKADAEATVKEINKELDAAEQLAVEQIRVSGLDGVRAAGKSWTTREWFSVSIPAENREAVLKVARKVCPDLVTVNTASLKSWLTGERTESGSEGASLSDGTPFAGLVREYREIRLSSRTIA